MTNSINNTNKICSVPTKFCPRSLPSFTAISKIRLALGVKGSISDATDNGKSSFKIFVSLKENMVVFVKIYDRLHHTVAPHKLDTCLSLPWLPYSHESNVPGDSKLICITACFLFFLPFWTKK
jgi:hypothetical protein